MRRHSLTMLAMVVCWLVSAAQTVKAADARVIVGSTGEPAVGVWVVGNWTTGGGFVHGGSGCIAVVTRTNEKGEFTLRGGLFGPRWPAAASFFAPGYRVESKPNFGQEAKVPFVIVPDTRTVSERVDYLGFLLRQTDCGTDYVLEHKAEFLPLYRAASAEAQEIAKTGQDRLYALAVHRWVYLVELGWEEMGQRIREEARILREVARKEALQKKPDAEIGMTTAEVMKETRWGRPRSMEESARINGRSVTPWDARWTYDEGGTLYFKNGRLTGIEENGLVVGNPFK